MPTNGIVDEIQYTISMKKKAKSEEKECRHTNGKLIEGSHRHTGTQTGVDICKHSITYHMTRGRHSIYFYSQAYTSLSLQHTTL